MRSSLPSQNQVEKIGRRRKTGSHPWRTSTSRKRMRHTHQESEPSSKKSQHPYNPRSPAGAFSARLGSTMSQSQGTQPISLQAQQCRPQSRQLLSDNLSRNSMLLNRCGLVPIASPEKQRTQSILSQSQLDIQSTPTGPGERGEGAAVPLTHIPLNKARDLASFDLVLQRSSSFVRTRSLTSTPQQSPGILDHRTEGTPPSSRNHAAAFHHSNSSSPPVSEAFVDSQYGLPVLQGCIETHQISGQTSDMDETRTNSCVRGHRFTIDEQVELETMNNNMGTLFGQPLHARMESAGCSSVNSRRVSSPIAMTGGRQDEAPGARVTPLRASDKYDSEHQQVCSFAAKDQPRELFPLASNLDYAEGTDFSLAPCHEDDSEAWLKYVFPDDMLHHQSRFFFGSAPEICPRDQKKDSPHFMPVHNTNEPAKPHHRDSSSIISNAPDDGLTLTSTRNTAMLTPGPQATCLRTDSLTQPTPTEGYLGQLANTLMYNNNAGGEWSLGSLPTQSLRHQVKAGSTQSRTQEQSIVPSKRKANDISEPEYSARPVRKYFERRQKQWSRHDHVPRAALWGAERDRKSETGDQQFLLAQNEAPDHGRDAHIVTRRCLGDARSEEHSSIQQFLEDAEDESTRSNLDPEASSDQHAFHQYTLPFSPPANLPPIWNNTIRNDQFHLLLAGSNPEPMDDTCANEGTYIPVSSSRCAGF